MTSERTSLLAHLKAQHDALAREEGDSRRRRAEIRIAMTELRLNTPPSLVVARLKAVGAWVVVSLTGRVA